MAYSTYDSYRAPALAHPSYSGHYPYGDSVRDSYGEFARYPYGDPSRGDYDPPFTDGGYGEWRPDFIHQPYQQPGYPMYAPPSTPYYGGGQYGGYDDLALDRRYSPDQMDYSNSIGPGALAQIPRRQRRSSSVSFARQLSLGTPSSPFYDGYHKPLIKFKPKGAFRSGITLSDAVAGARLSGGDYLPWNEMAPDSRGRVYLKVRWNGYASLTYEIPVDSYDGQVRLSTLARRVARACVHFIQVNAIPTSWDRVKLYHLEEISPGTWQPALTIH